VGAETFLKKLLSIKKLETHVCTVLVFLIRNAKSKRLVILNKVNLQIPDKSPLHFYLGEG
jgi:hypothetical protein